MRGRIDNKRNIVELCKTSLSYNFKDLTCMSLMFKDVISKVPQYSINLEPHGFTPSDFTRLCSAKEKSFYKKYVNIMIHVDLNLLY